jgi:hypothetical protein
MDDCAHYAYSEVYDKEGEAQADKDLSIFAHSLKDDPIFVEFYLFLFHRPNKEKEDSEKLLSIYDSQIAKGKSAIFAFAYAMAKLEEFTDFYCDMFAEAFEVAINHGMRKDEAYRFGDICTNACDQGYWLELKNYSKKYKEEWQKEYYIHLICKEKKQDENITLPSEEVDRIRKEFEMYK